MRIYVNDEFVKIRLIRGLTQRELAERSGLSRGYISLLERAAKSVGPAAAKRLCHALEADLEQIFVIR